MSRTHYCTCDKCGREMELGDVFYQYEGDQYCEDCFEEKVLKKIEKESRAKVTLEDCDDYDPNKGCFSYNW